MGECMKKSKIIWNYIDMFITVIAVFFVIFVVYIITEGLERYVYRYAVFPFVAVILIFSLGIFLGNAIEKTKKNKPIGVFSAKMAQIRKKKNVFIFSDNGVPYTPRKEIIEEIKSGEIVHVKQIHHSDFATEEFNDVYSIHMDDLVDDGMNMKTDEYEDDK